MILGTDLWQPRQLQMPGIGREIEKVNLEMVDVNQWIAVEDDTGVSLLIPIEKKKKNITLQCIFPSGFGLKGIFHTYTPLYEGEDKARIHYADGNPCFFIEFDHIKRIRLGNKSDLLNSYSPFNSLDQIRQFKMPEEGQPVVSINLGDFNTNDMFCIRHYKGEGMFRILILGELFNGLTRETTEIFHSGWCHKIIFNKHEFIPKNQILEINGVLCQYTHPSFSSVYGCSEIKDIQEIRIIRPPYPFPAV